MNSKSSSELKDKLEGLFCILIRYNGLLHEVYEHFRKANIRGNKNICQSYTMHIFNFRELIEKVKGLSSYVNEDLLLRFYLESKGIFFIFLFLENNIYPEWNEKFIRKNVELVRKKFYNNETNPIQLTSINSLKIPNKLSFSSKMSFRESFDKKKQELFQEKSTYSHDIFKNKGYSKKNKN